MGQINSSSISNVGLVVTGPLNWLSVRFLGVWVDAVLLDTTISPLASRSNSSAGVGLYPASTTTHDRPIRSALPAALVPAMLATWASGLFLQLGSSNMQKAGAPPICVPKLSRSTAVALTPRTVCPSVSSTFSIVSMPAVMPYPCAKVAHASYRKNSCPCARTTYLSACAAMTLVRTLALAVASVIECSKSAADM